MKLLISFGADLNQPIEKGSRLTPLLWIINRGNIFATTPAALKRIKFLLEHGADMYANDDYVGNALHLAAFKGHFKIIELLSRHEKKTQKHSSLIVARSTVAGKWHGLTAYEIALKRNMTKSVKLLESQLLDYVNQKSKLPEPETKRKKSGKSNANKKSLCL